MSIVSVSFVQVSPEVSAGGDRQEPRRPLGGADRARQREVRDQEVRELVLVRACHHHRLTLSLGKYQSTSKALTDYTQVGEHGTAQNVDIVPLCTHRYQDKQRHYL